MAIYSNTFEGGEDGVNITVANSGSESGTAWGTTPQPPTGTQWRYAVSAALGGSLGGLRTLDESSGYLRGDDPSPEGRGGMRRPFYYPGPPSVTATICMVRGTGDALMGSVVIATNGSVRLSTSASIIVSSASPILTPGQWYWVEIIATKGTDTTNGRLELLVQNANGTQFHTYDTGATVNASTVNATYFRFGGFANTTGWTEDRMDNVRWGGIASGWIGTDVQPPTVNVVTAKGFIADYRSSTPGTSGNTLTYLISHVSGPNNLSSITEPLEGLFEIPMDDNAESVYTVAVHEGSLTTSSQLTVPTTGVAASNPDTVERLYYEGPGTGWV